MKIIFKDISLEDALKSRGHIINDDFGNTYFRLLDWFQIEDGSVISIPNDEVSANAKEIFNSLEE